jgi:hypothetical protein
MGAVYSYTAAGWKSVTAIYLNTAVGWKPATAGYAYTAVGWKPFYSLGSTIASPVTITQSLNTTTYLVTLTGTNYSWSPAPTSLTYAFQHSTDAVTWTTISSGSIANPATGLSNTVSYTVVQADTTSQAINYYQFVVTASPSGSSKSGSTVIYSPTAISSFAASSSTPNSVSMSWGSATYANRYILYYYDPTSLTYQYAVNGGGGVGANSSATITSLSSNTTYTFFLVPYTGTTGTTLANATGYSSAAALFSYATTSVPLPVNSLVPTLSGVTVVGNTLAYGVGSWTNSPTSYDLRLYRGTAGVLTSETLVASSTANQAFYVITLADFNSGQLYFKTYASATNAGGTDTAGLVGGAELGPTTNTVVVTAPPTPTGLTITSSGLASWNASTGAASYTINYWLASSTSGANAFNAGTVNVGNTTSYQIPYATNPSTGVYCNYTDAIVLASNSAGNSSYSAWYPSSTTYV